MNKIDLVELLDHIPELSMIGANRDLFETTLHCSLLCFNTMFSLLFR